MTIESKEIIKTLLENNGYYPGDPQMSSIWSYEHDITHKILFAVFASESHNDIYSSPYATNPRLLWSRGGGLTSSGSRFLNGEKK